MISNMLTRPWIRKYLPLGILHLAETEKVLKYWMAEVLKIAKLGHKDGAVSDLSRIDQNHEKCTNRQTGTKIQKKTVTFSDCIVLFNNIIKLSERLEVDNDRLCAMGPFYGWNDFCIQQESNVRPLHLRVSAKPTKLIEAAKTAIILTVIWAAC